MLNTPGSTIDTPEAAAAAKTLQDWVRKGYLPDDVNAVDYTAMLGRFVAGQGLFMILGDWEAANLTKKMGPNVGFFATPPRDPDTRTVAASGPAPLLISKKAKNPDAAAYFLNWTQTNAAARQVIVDTSGNFPGGDPDLPSPTVPTNSVVKDTQAVFTKLAQDNGVVGVLVAATPGMLASTMTPQIQLLRWRPHHAREVRRQPPKRLREGPGSLNVRVPRRPGATTIAPRSLPPPASM